MAKKNLSSRECARTVLWEYTVPKLHMGKRWFVDFAAYDPISEKLKRKKYFIPEGIKVTEKRHRASELISALTKKLHQGWNPWVDTTSSLAFTEITTAIDRYSEYVSKGFRPRTYQAHLRMINIIKHYLSAKEPNIRFVFQITTDFLSRFLDYVYIDRNNTAVTRNHYRTWFMTFCGWLAERNYIESNPCLKIPKLKEGRKHRKALTAEMLFQLKKYLEENEKWFLLACMMEYYTFIRPSELVKIRLRDISLEKMKIFVSGTVSKNKQDNNVGLCETLVTMMLELGVFSYPGDYYLFSKGLKPGSKQMPSDIFSNRWATLREKLEWDDCYQFYSLKDSGIRDLANEAGIVVARDQARHSNVATTNKYLCGSDASVHEETKKFKGNLG